VLVGVIAVVFRSEPEPEYEGKKLSYWVVRYIDEQARDSAPVPEPEPSKVLLRLGTNCIPYFVKWMVYEPPIWKTSLYRLVNPFVRRLNASWELSDHKQGLAIGSMWAFTAMGTNARPAMPFLLQLLDDPNEVVRTAASNLVFTIDSQALKKPTATDKKELTADHTDDADKQK